MLASFQSGQPKKRSHVVSVDLGTKSTKAVHIQRKGQGFELVNFAVKDAPVVEKSLTPEILAEHLKSVLQSFGLRTRQVTLVVGVHDSLLRHAELPLLPVSDMRLMLKYNSKNYLQQDLPEYIFDCHILPLQQAASGEMPRNTKARVLVGGAKKQTLDMLQEAARQAGFQAELVVPSLVAPANAFEMAEPEAFSKEVVALVDIGFKNSTISILNNGELTLSRVVGIGGDKLSSGLAESMGVSYAEAEGIKVGLPDEVQVAMQSLLMPLGRELRASLDFFEHQQDKTVTQIYMSGGSSRSPFIVESLQSELMVPAKLWNPLSFMQLSLAPQQMGEVEQVAPQLAVAVGGAMAAF
ncbi:MAG: pilus assembly protein PilM [Verrucomicrobiota bacterium]|nr:pilus assembly protein PilM [Verrucomicrobiota bacterium]